METPAEVNESPLSRRCQKLLERRRKLPVWAYREKFLDTLAKHQIVVVAAPPGSVPDCFLRPVENQQAADEARANFSHINGDHLTLLNVYHAYKLHDGDSTWCENNFINQAVMRSADGVRNQLATLMQKLNLELCSSDFNGSGYYDNIRKNLLAGYFMQVAQLEHSGCYTIVKDHHILMQVVDLHPSSCLASRPAWVIYNDFVLGSRNFIRIITDVRREWLVDVAPHYYRIATI